jgi:hypothetical protein
MRRFKRTKVRKHGKIISFLSRLARKVFQPKHKERGTVKDLDSEAKLHAKAAKLAYSDLPSGSMPEGYEHERINDELSVLRNPTTKKAVIGIRGTQTIGDALTDIAHLTNIRDTDRYKRTKSQVKDLQDSLAGYDISLAGHSLGGTLAHHVADEFDMPAHIFNPGSTTGDVPKTTKVTAHMTVDDPVSMFHRNKGQTNTYTNPDKGVLAAHTIDAYAYGRRHGLFNPLQHSIGSRSLPF